MEITLQDALNATGGKLPGDGDLAQLIITSISTDTRTVKPGDCFVALVGEQFDAHDFLPAAVASGARVLVVHRRDTTLPESITQIVVTDTLMALGQLAYLWRSRFTLPVLALIGSSGKTTAKEMAGEIVSPSIPTLVTRGNLNNLIGLPCMLFELSAEHDAAILELGMNVPEENRRLTELALPSALLLTNITHAHIGMFDSLEAHYQAETEPLRHGSENALLIFNADDPTSQRARKEFAGSRQVWTFGLDNGADFMARNIKPLQPFGYGFDLIDKEGDRVHVDLRVFGRHNVSNALAAACVGNYFGIPLALIANRLSAFKPRLNRSEVEMIAGWHLIKDYYNAIPSAVKLALESIKDFDVAGKRYAVLGDMMELGEHERRFHEEVGESAAEAELDCVFTLGERGKIIHHAVRANGATAFHFESIETLRDQLLKDLQPGDLLLIKGSRALKLEQLYELLKTAKPAASY